MAAVMQQVRYHPPMIAATFVVVVPAEDWASKDAEMAALFADFLTRRQAKAA